MPPLDLTALKNALEQLQEGLKAAEAEPKSEIVRDGVIQRFEYSHELALRFMKRILEIQHGDLVDQMGYNNLLRTASERGYIENVEKWFDYRTSRNQSSHTYDGSVAAIVFAAATPFLADALFLLKRLEERSA